MRQVMTRPTHLFFYGILQEVLGPDGGDWPFLAGLGMSAPATTTGALYAIPAAGGEGATGWFPALVLTHARYSTVVHGMIHDAGEVDLAAVDAFEGAEYTRQPVAVDGWDGFGETLADAYVWTADLPDGAEPIASGNFAEWLAQTGRRPWSGE